MARQPTSPTPDAPDPEGEAGPGPTAAIRDAVLAALGHPPGLYRVVVAALWADFYRVNVLVGPDYATALIRHSYFVEAGGTGQILTAAPSLTRMYP